MKAEHLIRLKISPIDANVIETEDGQFGTAIFSMYRNAEENATLARRIVACVNACAGIADPETTVLQLILAVEWLYKHIKEHAPNDPMTLAIAAVLAKMGEKKNGQ